MLHALPVLLYFSSLALRVRAEDGIHLPLYRKVSRSIQRRDNEVGLGDYLDVTYNVLMNVGGTQTPLLIDTGSSDLWVVSDTCSSSICSQQSVPLYPQAGFKSTGLTAQLFYGDSTTGTHAFGLIGQDSASVGGMALQNQLFAAINNTNTSVLETGSAGILGLGFPINSGLLVEVFSSENPSLNSDSNKARALDSDLNRASFPSLSRFSGSRNRATFPSLSQFGSSTRSLSARASTSTWTPQILASYTSIGPPIWRILAAQNLAPMFTVTLQRDTVDVGGNEGVLSIGSLPSGVKDSSLTWAQVRLYSAEDGGLPAPPDSPNEEYPIAWEIPIDDVYLDGQKLPRSSLVSSSISLSALVDTGNSLIRGPSDVIANINKQLGGQRFACSTPHSLAFQINGEMFPVDPRDFVNQVFQDSVGACSANLAATDTPEKGGGYLYSWSLGDPFLKRHVFSLISSRSVHLINKRLPKPSVLASFYFGNTSYPSKDSPRIGFLSTVPGNANDLYTSAVQAASNNGGNFPATSNPAPSGSPTSAGTNSDGVGQAQATSGTGSSTPHSNGAAPGAIHRPLTRLESWLGTVLITGTTMWWS